jgi:hypothetical protein
VSSNCALEHFQMKGTGTAANGHAQVWDSPYNSKTPTHKLAHKRLSFRSALLALSFCSSACVRVRIES